MKDRKKWEEQMQKYKEYAEELKQMRNNLNKIDERYKKSLEVFKNGKRD